MLEQEHIVVAKLRYDTHLVGAMVWEKEVGLSHPAQKQLLECTAATISIMIPTLESKSNVAFPNFATYPLCT